MIKNTIFSIFILLNIIACVPQNSYISFNNNHISISSSKEYFFNISANILEQKSINFASMYLRQYILKLPNSEIITYEYAKTDFSYEFEPNIHRIIKTVFEAKGLIPIYGENHIYAYQIILSNGSLLNLIGYQSDSQNLKLVYGMSTHTFNKMIHSLNPNAPKAKYTHVNQIKSIKNAIFSKWDDRKVHFVPLVVPLPRLMGPF